MAATVNTSYLFLYYTFTGYIGSYDAASSLSDALYLPPIKCGSILSGPINLTILYLQQSIVNTIDNWGTPLYAVIPMFAYFVASFVKDGYDLSTVFSQGFSNHFDPYTSALILGKSTNSLVNFFSVYLIYSGLQGTPIA